MLLGIGVNLTSAAALPAVLAEAAAGVAEAGGRSVSPEEMLAALSTALGERWRQAADEPASLTAAWRSRLLTLGQRVRLAVPASGPGASVVEGLALDVSPTGELLIRSADGATTAYAAADVTTSGPPGDAAPE